MSFVKRGHRILLEQPSRHDDRGNPQHVVYIIESQTSSIPRRCCWDDAPFAAARRANGVAGTALPIRDIPLRFVGHRLAASERHTREWELWRCALESRKESHRLHEMRAGDRRGIASDGVVPRDAVFHHVEFFRGFVAFVGRIQNHGGEIEHGRHHGECRNGVGVSVGRRWIPQARSIAAGVRRRRVLRRPRSLVSRKGGVLRDVSE